MKTSSSFSVSFYARTQKASNGIVPIYAIITVNSRRVNISTKKKIALDDWSEKGGKAKSTNKEAD